MEEQVKPSAGDWKGYTLEELRYQKAITLVRIEMQKQRIASLKTTFTDYLVPQSFWGRTLKSLAANRGKIGYVIAGYKIFMMVRGFLKARK